MANLPISGLPNGSALTGTELLVAVQGGTTVQTTAEAVLNYVTSSISSQTIDTGSFATTGSNTFIGNQTITGTVNATNFTGSLLGTASTSNQLLVSQSVANTNFKLLFATTGDGYKDVLQDSGIDGTYNPWTNTLTATNLAGTATNATNVNIATNSTNTNYYVTFGFGSGNNRVTIDGGGQFTYNPSTNTLTVPTIVSNLTGTATTASYVETAQTASYVLNAISSSYALSASYVETAQTASYVETAQTASYVLNAVSASFATTASYVPSGLPEGGTTGQVLIKSSGTDYNTTWSDPANLPFVAYAKDADQDILTAQIVTFPSTPILSAGDSFGSMASTGIYTFTQTGNYLITINFNTSEYQTTNYGDLDIWGRLNASNDPRYTQLATNAVKKGSVTEVIPITASNTTFDWWSNNSCTVYGSGGTKTRISIVKLN